MIRSYTELSQIESYEERFRYLKLDGVVGRATFGSKRVLNQRFYFSEEWKRARDYVITRDNGCDMGVPGFEVGGPITVHHMNPVMIKDVTEFNPDILNPEYLITVSSRTHKAIHYGDEGLLPLLPIERKPNDMCPWKQ